MTKEKANLYYFAIIHITALALLSVGCATQGKSVGLGGAIGAGTGAVLGGIADPGKDGEYRTRNVIVGSAFGGIIGMAAGSSIHSKIEKEKKMSYAKGLSNGQATTPTPPKLTETVVETKWIKGTRVGNRYIEGHYEYVISEPPRWEDN